MCDIEEDVTFGNEATKPSNRSSVAHLQFNGTAHEGAQRRDGVYTNGLHLRQNDVSDLPDQPDQPERRLIDKKSPISQLCSQAAQRRRYAAVNGYSSYNSNGVTNGKMNGNINVYCAGIKNGASNGTFNGAANDATTNNGTLNGLISKISNHQESADLGTDQYNTQSYFNNINSNGTESNNINNNNKNININSNGRRSDNQLALLETTRKNWKSESNEEPFPDTIISRFANVATNILSQDSKALNENLLNRSNGATSHGPGRDGSRAEMEKENVLDSIRRRLTVEMEAEAAKYKSTVEGGEDDLSLCNTVWRFVPPGYQGQQKGR